MKLVIQIPCYNEAKTLPVTLAALPRRVDGFDVVEWLVIDDGSSDGTADVARSWHVDHIVQHGFNRGLAQAFMTGIRTALDRGADVIVNTDADNQYNADDIPQLLEPIRAGRAGFVVGIRPVYEASDMPWLIRVMHKVGSLVVMKASGTAITDPPSGFRAFTRDVAGRLQVHNRYTYTLETIIQAGNSGIAVEPVAIRINGKKLRPSRLMSSPYSYVAKSAVIILRSLLVYNPRRFLAWVAMPPVLALVLAGVLWFIDCCRLSALVVLGCSALALFCTLLIAYPVLVCRGAYAGGGDPGGGASGTA